jgi:TolA-binding protein
MKLNLNKKKNRSGSIQINKFRNYTINTLSEQNNKMAGEIERLNLSVSELSGDNANIKCVLDMKKTSGPRRTKRPRNHQNLLSTKKRFHSHLMHFKYFMWKNQVLAMTKIPKKPIPQRGHLRTQLVVESFQNPKARD